MSSLSKKKFKQKRRLIQIVHGITGITFKLTMNDSTFFIVMYLNEAIKGL